MEPGCRILMWSFGPGTACLPQELRNRNRILVAPCEAQTKLLRKGPPHLQSPPISATDDSANSTLTRQLKGCPKKRDTNNTTYHALSRMPRESAQSFGLRGSLRLAPAPAPASGSATLASRNLCGGRGGGGIFNGPPAEVQRIRGSW